MEIFSVSLNNRRLPRARKSGGDLRLNRGLLKTLVGEPLAIVKPFHRPGRLDLEGSLLYLAVLRTWL